MIPPQRISMLFDPPWNEKGGGNRGADSHYPVMSTPDILKVIMQSGMWTPNPRCCSVWMWATVNYLAEALWLMERLGAVYVTNDVWVKGHEVLICDNCGRDVTGESHCPECSSDGCTAFVSPQNPGLGQHRRICHEHLLFGRIGRVPVPATGDRLPSTLYAPRRRHSQKPESQYERIERHDGPGSRLEFFARSAHPGWDCWGNEAPTNKEK